MNGPVLVTGASGFIGSEVVRHLHEQGIPVVATARAGSAELSSDLRVRVTTMDLLDPEVATRSWDAETVIHCATANDILSRDFHAGVRLSVDGTRNLLEAAVKNGVRNLIFLSTLQVYGTELEGTVRDETPTRCETPYALNHWMGEEVCRMYARRHPDLNVVILRPANVYGVPAARTVNRGTLVPACFVPEAMASGEIVIRSSGKQRRNFVSTREVAEGCVRLLRQFPVGVTTRHFGSSWLASIREVADMVAREYGSLFGRDLRVTVLSDRPATGSNFSLEGEFGSIWSVEQSVTHMRGVIYELLTRASEARSAP